MLQNAWSNYQDQDNITAIFQGSFPVKYKSMENKNCWITQEIKISCKHKRRLYAFTKNSNDPKNKSTLY
jgi:hypothetical protein